MPQLTASASSSELAVQRDPTPAMAERIRGEFREMPGLTLTLPQACRLWNLDPNTCREVLAQLVDAAYLCRRPDGAFCRGSGMAARPLRMAKAKVEVKTLR
jgi:hypothetical protein